MITAHGQFWHHSTVTPKTITKQTLTYGGFEYLQMDLIKDVEEEKKKTTHKNLPNSYQNVLLSPRRV